MRRIDKNDSTSFLKHDDLMTELFAASLFLPVALCIDNLSDSYFDQFKKDGPLDASSIYSLAGCSMRLLITIALCLAGMFALGFSFQTLTRNKDSRLKFAFCFVSSLAFAFCILLINGRNPIMVQVGLNSSLFWSGCSLLALDWRDWDRQPHLFLAVIAISVPISLFLYVLSGDL